MGHPREEVETAFARFLELGAHNRDWPAWAGLFTDDARYIEHNLGEFTGRAEIERWIVKEMAPFGAMTFSIDWSIIEGDRVAFYIWNHLPDPEGGDARYSFPNLSVIEYAGDGKWGFEEDLYNPADANRVVGDWFRAGGSTDTPPDESLTAIPDHTPAPSTASHPREEIEEAFERYRQRGATAVGTGDWDQWAEQFTEDARYYEHHYGRFSGREEIRAWIKGVMQPFPTMEFPFEWVMIDGNRVVAYVQNRLPDPAGGDERYEFPTGVILHYAGDDRWSYEEDAYNPDEAPPVVERWLAAGGKLPDDFNLEELIGG